MAAMTSPGSRFRLGQGKWCYPHATLPPPTNGGISTTTAGYKTESEYADSSVVRRGIRPPGTMSPDDGAKEASGGVACSNKALTHINAECHPAPFSMFPMFLPFLFPTRPFLRKGDPGSSRTNEISFVRQEGGGIDPWPNLNSTSIERRKTNLRRNNSRQQQNKQHQTSRGSQNVAPKTQPRPSRPHPKLLLRLHANRPPRRRPRRSNHNRHTKHIHPLRRRPPTPLLRIRHLHHSTIHLPSPQALPLLLLLAPCAPATIQTPTANVPNPHAHPGTEAGAGVSSPRRRGARKARGRAGVLL